MEDRLWLVESCDVYLTLFEAIHVERDLGKAESLAPILNRHVPELMIRCPKKELRPTEQEMLAAKTIASDASFD